MLVPVRHVEGVRRKKLASGLNGPTQDPCKRGHSKNGTRPDIMASTTLIQYLCLPTYPRCSSTANIHDCLSIPAEVGQTTTLLARPRSRHRLRPLCPTVARRCHRHGLKRNQQHMIRIYETRRFLTFASIQERMGHERLCLILNRRWSSCRVRFCYDGYKPQFLQAIFIIFEPSIFFVEKYKETARCQRPW